VKWIAAARNFGRTRSPSKEHSRLRKGGDVRYAHSPIASNRDHADMIRTIGSQNMASHGLEWDSIAILGLHSSIAGAADGLRNKS
jgi:hypothetical protein